MALSALQPRLQIRSRSPITRSKRSLHILSDSAHPTRNISTKFFIVLVLESVNDVLSPVCLGPTGVVDLGISATASGLEEAGSRVDFEEFDDTVWLKDTT